MDGTLERIIETMQKQQISDYALEEFLGMPHGTVSNWKREKGRSYYYYIVQISDKLSVPTDFLLRGMNDTGDLTGQEKRLIENFRKLSDEAKDVTVKTVSLLCGNGR